MKNNYQGQVRMWVYNIFLLCLVVFASGVFSTNSINYEKLNSKDIQSNERNELLSKLDQDDTFEALKFAGNLFFFGNEIIIPNYEKSLNSFERAYNLNQSDSDVLFMIGLMYNYGVGCELDPSKGLMFTIASARLGNVKAHSALAHVLYYGFGIKTNCASARMYLINAAKQTLREMSPKDAVSVRKPIRLSIKSPESEKVKSQQEALEYYEYSAKSGDGTSSLLLAQLYYFGTEGSDPDYEKARHYFESAVTFGHDAANAFLGQIYYRGEGVPVDYQKAYEYFLKGAERNIPSALNGLGLMYWKGQVVERDLDTAEAFFKRAADLKYPEAFYNYAMILLEQPAIYSKERAFNHFLAATKTGYVFANVEIVKRYLKSENSCSTSISFLKQILDKGPSLKMFKEAYNFYLSGFEDQALSRYIYLAAHGFEVANFNAGFILEQSKSQKHFKRAAFFYSRSASMDNSIARRKLGDAYSKMGDSVSAVAHYLLAAKSSTPDAEALFNLGYAYETGLGLKKDLWSAIDMYTASLSHGKSGKMAVTLALTKIRVKMFFEDLKNFKYRNNSQKRTIRKSLSKSRRESNKIISMLATLLLTGVIYWYINFFQPRQQRRNAQLAARTVTEGSSQNSSSPNNRTNSPSVHSDSSSSPPTETSNMEFTSFRFRQSPVVKPEEIDSDKNKIEEEVD